MRRLPERETMKPTKPTLPLARRRGLSLALAAAAGLLAPAALAGEPLIDPTALDAARAWNSPLWRGVRGPTDPHVRASFEEEVGRLLDAEEAIDGDPEASAAEGEHDHVDDPVPGADAAPVEPPAWPHTVSIGTPNRGWLAYGEALAAGDHFTVREKFRYGTREAIDAIEAAAAAVHAQFPDTPRLHVGDISSKKGGRLKRHLSHQSGRDADIAYYLKSGHDEDNLKRATPRTLDVPRTWAFIAALVEGDRVEYLFSDRRLMRVLEDYARDVAEVPPERLEELFGSKTKAGIIRHLRGHADHLHVRFKAPASIAAVREYVKRHGVEAIEPLPVYAKVRRGDSLWKLARRHNTSIKKLTQWNRISRKKVLRPGQKLVIGWRRPSLPEVDRDS